MVSHLFILFFGVVLCTISGVCAYLAAPRQLLAPNPLSKRVGLGGACVLAVAGIMLLQQSLSVVTAVFILALVLMLVWSLVPLCAALLWSR